MIDNAPFALFLSNKKRLVIHFGTAVVQRKIGRSNIVINIKRRQILVLLRRAFLLLAVKNKVFAFLCHNKPLFIDPHNRIIFGFQKPIARCSIDDTTLFFLRVIQNAVDKRATAQQHIVIIDNWLINRFEQPPFAAGIEQAAFGFAL